MAHGASPVAASWAGGVTVAAKVGRSAHFVSPATAEERRAEGAAAATATVSPRANAAAAGETWCELISPTNELLYLHLESAEPSLDAPPGGVAEEEHVSEAEFRELCLRAAELRFQQQHPEAVAASASAPEGSPATSGGGGDGGGVQRVRVDWPSLAFSFRAGMRPPRAATVSQRKQVCSSAADALLPLLLAAAPCR